MRTILRLIVGGAFLFPATSLTAQESELQQICNSTSVQTVGARDSCLATVQAVNSAQPAVGILVSGGNPTLGSAGASGLRLGLIPRVSAGVRLNVVPIRLPDILADELSGTAGSLTKRFGVPAPALAGDVSIGVFNGISLAPTIGGIGGVSLLGSVSYIPVGLLDGEGFEKADLAYGYGARLHLLGESFLLPGVSISVMRRSLPQLAFGDICPDGIQSGGVPGPTPNSQAGACAGDGDAGEFSFDLQSWSTRLVASKRLLGLGATAGIGYDSYDSEIGFGFRGTTGSAIKPVFRVTDQPLESSRWTAFGNLSYTLLVATLSLEGGWQQGDAPITSFDNLESDFDPEAGSWFGSIGARLSL